MEHDGTRGGMTGCFDRLCAAVDHDRMISTIFYNIHGSLNVPIEHHPTIRYMVYNGYYKVMFNIPKMGQLPTPDINQTSHTSRISVEHGTSLSHPPTGDRIIIDAAGLSIRTGNSPHWPHKVKLPSYDHW